MKGVFGVFLIIIGSITVVAGIVMAPMSIFAMAWTQAGQGVYFGLVAASFVACAILSLIGWAVLSMGRAVLDRAGK